MLQFGARLHDFVWYVLKGTIPILGDFPESNEIMLQSAFRFRHKKELTICAVVQRAEVLAPSQRLQVDP